jgi:hypothetical protein
MQQGSPLFEGTQGAAELLSIVYQNRWRALRTAQTLPPTLRLLPRLSVLSIRLQLSRHNHAVPSASALLAFQAGLNTSAMTVFARDWKFFVHILTPSDAKAVQRHAR